MSELGDRCETMTAEDDGGMYERHVRASARFLSDVGCVDFQLESNVFLMYEYSEARLTNR